MPWRVRCNTALVVILVISIYAGCKAVHGYLRSGEEITLDLPASGPPAHIHKRRSRRNGCHSGMSSLVVRSPGTNSCRNTTTNSLHYHVLQPGLCPGPATNRPASQLHHPRSTATVAAALSMARRVCPAKPVTRLMTQKRAESKVVLASSLDHCLCLQGFLQCSCFPVHRRFLHTLSFRETLAR